MVAAERSAGKAKEVFGALGLTEGLQADGGPGVLFVEPGVDITQPATLGPHVWQGVSQVRKWVGV